MCIIFFVANDGHCTSSCKYKLILASNRDELYSRPAQAVSVWNNADHVIGGKDLENGREGGTWLGISAENKRIKMGALLNIPGEKSLPDKAAGRGPIVANYLMGNSSSFDYSDALIRDRVEYNAFNFVALEFNEDNKSCQILHCSNTPNGIKEFPNNTVLGFSNSPWSSPLQKVDHGKKLFSLIIEKDHQSQEDLVADLMNLLCDKTPFLDDEELHRRVCSGRVPQFSSIFVSLPDMKYGSRTRTVILLDYDNNLDFYEETLEEGDTWKRSHIQRQLI